MTQKARELYRSANGDRWSLVHDYDSGLVFVRHEPNCRTRCAQYTPGTPGGRFLKRRCTQ
jgi:hypothetical protein